MEGKPLKGPHSSEGFNLGARENSYLKHHTLSSDSVNIVILYIKMLLSLLEPPTLFGPSGNFRDLCLSFTLGHSPAIEMPTPDYESER